MDTELNPQAPNPEKLPEQELGCRHAQKRTKCTTIYITREKEKETYETGKRHKSSAYRLSIDPESIEGRY